MKTWIVGLLFASISSVHCQVPVDLQKAADQGNADAQNAIGKIYLSGKGVPKDFGKAMEWFKKSADQSEAEAQDIKLPRPSPKALRNHPLLDKNCHSRSKTER
jgi:hypothetical protein